MLKPVKLLIFFIVLLFSFQSVSAVSFPLKKSANNRYFVDQNNTPFFINGDTPWSLIGQVTLDDAKLYIQDSANKNINSLIITLVEGYYADNAPNNYDNIPPFDKTNNIDDFSKPNTAYFEHADAVINYASQFGIQVIIAPMYLGCCNDGWLSTFLNDSVNSTTAIQKYGTFIGNRYKNISNIMYVWGNDLNPCGVNGNTSSNCNQRIKLKALVDAVKAADPNHLHVYHWSPEYSPLELSNRGIWYTWDSLKDVNATYTYNPVQDKVLQDYNRVVSSTGKVEPFFLFETHYENDFGGANSAKTRWEAYTALLSGAAGHHYGNEPLWHLNFKNGGGDGWKSHLNDGGRAALKFIKPLFESRSWFTLIPDQTYSILTNGYSSGTSYAAAAQTEDKSTLIIYTPSSRTLTVNLTKMSGTQSKAYWFNPTNGVATLIGTYNNTNTAQNFSATGETLLVVDDVSKNYSVPGSSVIPTPAVTPTTIPTIAITPTKTPTPSTSPTINSKFDVNKDGVINLLDVMAVLNEIFK